MSKKNLLVVGAIVIGLGIGTLIGLQQTEVRNTEIATAQDQNWQQKTTKEQTKELLGEFMSWVENEKKTGCYIPEYTKEGKEKIGKFCDASLEKYYQKEKEFNEKITTLNAGPKPERIKRLELIKKISNDPNAEAVFKEVRWSDCGPESEVMEEVYYDKKNYTYFFFNPSNGELVGIQGGIAVFEAGEEALEKPIFSAPKRLYTNEQLKERADKFLQTYAKDVCEKTKKLRFEPKFSEAGYSARWGESVDNPVLQIGIDTEGKIMFFKNCF